MLHQHLKEVNNCNETSFEELLLCKASYTYNKLTSTNSSTKPTVRRRINPHAQVLTVDEYHQELKKIEVNKQAKKVKQNARKRPRPSDPPSESSSSEIDDGCVPIESSSSESEGEECIGKKAVTVKFFGRGIQKL